MAAAPSAQGGAGDADFPGLRGFLRRRLAGVRGALLSCAAEVVRTMSIVVGPALHLAHLIPDIKSRCRDSVQEPGLLRAALLMRERLGSTAVGHGFAVPNARSLLVSRPALLLSRSRSGVDWGAEDGALVQLILLVISPAQASAPCHVAAVARVMTAVRSARARQRLFASDSPEEVAGLLGVAL
jgi:mannitol/fructose-specific phosphotransferase system IIA component (Ntr-type)